MTCVGLVQHQGEAMKRSVLKPGFEGSADRNPGIRMVRYLGTGADCWDFTEALVQKLFRVAESDGCHGFLQELVVACLYYPCSVRHSNRLSLIGLGEYYVLPACQAVRLCHCPLYSVIRRRTTLVPES